MPRVSRYFLVLSLLLIILSPMQASAADRVQKTGDPIIIVIDPGHGGENNGTTENGFLEKEMTMTTAITMMNELKQFDGIEVYLTHYDDKDLSLKERAKVAAGYKADFLISLHYNASESHKLFGAEAWVSLNPEYHNQGYQLGTMFLREFRDMGLTLRGIKTKRHSNGNDYYGILRESVALGVPAIIIEHCHVDHARDNIFCDSEEELVQFGKADARAVAKYFGLKSTALSLDYSEDAKTLPEVTVGTLVPRAAQDQTNPIYCNVRLLDANFDEDRITVEISASDPDSNLICYSYSLDAGFTFCDDLPWPEGDILTGEFEGKFTTEIEIPDGMKPNLCVRATNPYDMQTISNVIVFDKVFQKPVITETEEKEVFTEVVATPVETPDPSLWEQLSDLEKIIYVLRIAAIVSACLFVFFLILSFLHFGKAHKSEKNDRAE